jgi:hypothetical protein
VFYFLKKNLRKKAVSRLKLKSDIIVKYMAGWKGLEMTIFTPQFLLSEYFRIRRV